MEQKLSFLSWILSMFYRIKQRNACNLKVTAKTKNIYWEKPLPSYITHSKI